MLLKKQQECSTECSIHQRNLKILMTEIYKMVNGIAPPIMNSLFEYYHLNLCNLRNFQELSPDKRSAVNYGLETLSYGTTAIWAKLVSSSDKFKLK